MTVNQVRPEADGRKCRQHRLGEEGIAFDLEQRIIGIDRSGIEQVLIVDEIIGDTIHLRTQDADVHASPVKVHVKACNILHLIFHILLHAGILRHNHANIIEFPVNFLRQRSDHIGKSAGLDKRHSLRSSKQYVSHSQTTPCPMILPPCFPDRQSLAVNMLIHYTPWLALLTSHS